jgi:hypothetical protein
MPGVQNRRHFLATLSSAGATVHGSVTLLNFRTVADSRRLSCFRSRLDAVF